MSINIHERLKVYHKVLSTENCLLIYFYLLIYGRSDPSTLIEKLDIGKTTLYRNLELLQSIEVVNRTDNTVDDGRKTTLYFISNPFTNFTEVNELISKIEDPEDQQIKRNEWKQIYTRTPTIFSDITSKLFILLNSHETIVSNRVGDMAEEKNLKLSFFSIYDHSRIPEIEDEIRKLLDLIASKKEKIADKKNMTTPTSLLINYVRFST